MSAISAGEAWAVGFFGSTPTQTLASADEQEAADIGPDGRFAGLNDTQLKALLGEIDRLEAVPVTEPDPVMIKVNLANPGSPEGAR